ncbi:hypothetical protein [Veillonella parvula]|uniref:hypothetical protein n=1 Tax=Veillonella parvula TaxID=29466 RepID=UPI00265CA104|nr:hypothetical protein [Veillonella parvula]
MFRKSLLLGGLIAVLCLSGCGNAQELPGYNPKVVGNEMYKNDLMDKILNERIYKAISAGGDREEAEILFRLDEMTADQRRNLNYSISRAQYNAVTEVHMHTAEGGLSYTLPFTAFRGGTQMVPVPGMAGTDGSLYRFNHPFIYTSLSMESRPYEESAQYLGKPYKELKQDDVRSALQEKWTNMQQDQYDVSSIDGSTFKRDNIINGRWSTMKTKETPSFVANDISFALPNEPNTQYVITLLVREDGERGIGKRGIEDIIANYLVPSIFPLARLNDSSHFESLNNYSYRVLNNAIEESTGSDNIKVYKTPGGITQTISVYPYEHKGPIWANLADILRITQAQLRLQPNMRYGSHKYIWNDGAPGVLTVFAYEDGTGELRFSTQDAHNLYIHTINYNRATNDYNIGLLHSIISDAKIANLGDTYKGEVDLL